MNFQNMPVKVAIYARVSTDEQADRGTIGSQIEFAHRYCDLNGIHIVKIYQDDGITGTLPLQDRPAGSALIRDARKHMFNTVLVYKLDRLGRSTRVILNAVYDLENADVQTKSMTEPFDTSDASGRFLLTILAGVADLDRSNILERMWLGANRAAKEGIWLGGIVPFGYIKNKDKYLEINNEPMKNSDMSEADVVRLIYDMCGNEGKSTIEISEHLNALHIPTAYVAHGITGKRHKHVSGNWLAGRIRNMIVSTTYKGIHQYGKRASRKRETIERKVPAIVSEELWEKAQQTLRCNQLDAFRNAKHDGLYLLRGLIKCKNCGASYQGSGSHATKSGKKYYSYYRCSKNSHYRGMNHSKCSSKAIRMDWIDDWIWEQCLMYINNPKVVCASIQENRPANGQSEDEVQAIQKQLNQETMEKKRLVQLYTAGLIDMDDVTAQIETINKNRKRLEERLEELTHQKEEIFAKVEVAEEILDKLKEKINSGELTQELKRSIVRTLVNRIEVFTNEKGKVEVKSYFKFNDTSTIEYDGGTRNKNVNRDIPSKRNAPNFNISYYSTHGCPCGWHGDPDHICECTPNEIKRYTRKISGPLLDRIDIHVHVARVEYKDLSSAQKAESSAEIRKRVVAARELQLERFRRCHIFSNAQMNHAQIRKFCPMTKSAQSVLEQIFNQLHLSARSYDRMIKVSRTIADLDKSDIIADKHIGEAIQFRSGIQIE